MFDLESEVKKESLNYFNAQVRIKELESQFRVLLYLWDSSRPSLHGNFWDEMEVARSLLEKTYSRIDSIPPIAHAVPPTTGG